MATLSKLTAGVAVGTVAVLASQQGSEQAAQTRAAVAASGNKKGKKKGQTTGGAQDDEQEAEQLGGSKSQNSKKKKTSGQQLKKVSGKSGKSSGSSKGKGGSKGTEGAEKAPELLGYCGTIQEMKGPAANTLFFPFSGSESEIEGKVTSLRDLLSGKSHIQIVSEGSDELERFDLHDSAALTLERVDYENDEEKTKAFPVKLNPKHQPAGTVGEMLKNTFQCHSKCGDLSERLVADLKEHQADAKAVLEANEGKVGHCEVEIRSGKKSYLSYAGKSKVSAPGVSTPSTLMMTFPGKDKAPSVDAHVFCLCAKS